MIYTAVNVKGFKVISRNSIYYFTVPPMGVDLVDFELCFVLFPIYFPEVLEVVLHDDVVCTPDAAELLLSMFGLLSVSMPMEGLSIVSLKNNSIQNIA